jgi:hypothetical protein
MNEKQAKEGLEGKGVANSLKSVSYLSLYRHAKSFDKLLIFVGTITAMAN